YYGGNSSPKVSFQLNVWKLIIFLVVKRVFITICCTNFLIFLVESLEFVEDILFGSNLGSSTLTIT
ncbi:MAG: hypothetical protein K2Q34_01510, partial [Alphaproteobacteria bacterium]|nr:hypothetical protein [Alphaproteobacteria bacterium]